MPPIKPVAGKPGHYVDADGKEIILRSTHTSIVRAIIEPGDDFVMQVGEGQRLIPIRLAVVPNEPQPDGIVEVRSADQLAFDASVRTLVAAYGATHQAIGMPGMLGRAIADVAVWEDVRRVLTGFRLPGTESTIVPPGYALTIKASVRCQIEVELVWEEMIDDNKRGPTLPSSPLPGKHSMGGPYR